MIQPTPINGRTEFDILGQRGIAIEMGDATYRLRPLTMDGTDVWEGQIRDVIGTMFGRLATAAGGVDGILGLYRASIDSQLDALYAYDETGHGDRPMVLPEREVLRRTASRDDLDEALRKLVKHEFPLLKGMDFLGSWVPAEVREIITRQLIRLLPEASPQAPSSPASSPTTRDTATRRRSARR